MPTARLAATLAAVLLVACGGGSTSASPTPSAQRATPRPPPPALGPLVFQPCGDGLECGTLSVPLDRTDAASGAVPMAVVRRPATDRSHRVGSLLVNPGGPGASGVEFVRSSGSLFAGLQTRFDIVGFDPRGTGSSRPVRCADGPLLDRVVGSDPIADDPAEHAALLDAARSVAQRCAAEQAAMLPHVGTNEVARDLDALRAALGDSKLTYLGFSYGTEIGTEYARLFPGHVRAMVLDGDVDPRLSLLDQVTGQADGLEHALQAFATRCRGISSCPLAGDPVGRIDSLLARLDSGPLVVGDRHLGRGEALIAILAGLYDPRAWDALATIVDRAASGDGSTMLKLTDLYSGRAADGSYSPMITSGAAVTCADHPSPGTPADIDARAAAVQARDPHFGDSAVYGLLACSFWAVHGGGAPPGSPLPGLPPVLLVGATGDPVTPYAWSQSLQSLLGGSVLLTRRGDGHASYDKSDCIRAAVDAYLTALTAPPAGTVCPS